MKTSYDEMQTHHLSYERIFDFKPCFSDGHLKVWRGLLRNGLQSTYAGGGQQNGLSTHGREQNQISQRPASNSPNLLGHLI